MTETNRASGNALAQRRLIFCINPGRSGSHYLGELLSTAAAVCNFHDPDPHMTGRYLRMITDQPYEASRAERRIKCEAIRTTLRGMEPEQVYAETSHMFIKTFFDVVLDEFKNVDVIILRRDMAHVLKSCVELGYFWVPNRRWADWMSSPDAVTAALPPPRPPAEMDQFDRCIAYLLDIEARAIRFQRDYPEVRVHEAQLESLNSFDAVADLFAGLRLESTGRTRELCGRPVNERPHRKAEVSNPTTLEICQVRLQRYLELLPRAPTGSISDLQARRDATHGC